MTGPYRIIGSDFRRVDGIHKLTGQARYLADMAVPGMLHAAILRSPVAHGRVVRLDVSAAAALPGVHAVLVPDDVAHLPKCQAFSRSPRVGTILTDRPLFAGDAVVAIAADTAELARQALELVDIEFDVLEAVLDLEAARRAEVTIHDEAPDNRAGPPVEFSQGDVEAALAAADLVVEGTYRTQRQLAQTIEPMSCVCSWLDDRLEVWTHLDNFFHFREGLAELVGVEEHFVRINAPDALGATFGLKNGMQPSLEPVAALLSKKAGRPVKLALTPEESLSATVCRHPAVITLTTGVRRDGTIVARRAQIELDAGASGFGYIVAFAMLGKWVTLYPVDDCAFAADSFYTNHLPSGAYRAVGTAQLHFAMESQMDEIARLLDIDPVELRRQNAVHAGGRLPFGTAIRSLGIEECLDDGARQFGWGQPVDQPADPNCRRGVGMALGFHSSGLTGLLPTREESSCRVGIDADGLVTVSIAAVDKGQGAESALTAVAAEELGIELVRVVLDNQHTDALPFDLMGAEASRGTYVQGRAVQDAARRLKERLDAGERAEPGTPLVQEGYFAPDDADPLPVIGAHFCEVDVDLVTGLVTVNRYVAAQDVGRVVSELACRGQIEGAVHHGLGYALIEEFKYADGQPLNPNFMGYKVLMAGDMPATEALMIEVPDPDGGPFGAKGVGTPALPAVAAALANAVFDAVGVRADTLPISPRRLLPALRAHGLVPTWAL
jgi:xanthine dehydrogenase molybdenum-binding subunit